MIHYVILFLQHLIVVYNSRLLFRIFIPIRILVGNSPDKFSTIKSNESVELVNIKPLKYILTHILREYANKYVLPKFFKSPLLSCQFGPFWNLNCYVLVLVFLEFGAADTACILVLHPLIDALLVIEVFALCVAQIRGNNIYLEKTS